MHYLVNPSPRVLASTEEIIGLIRTAGEILDFQIPPDATPALILDVNSESMCRVAAYRLTNCVGAYNSGRTDNGHEPRWAYKDGTGVWMYHSKAHHGGSRPVGMSRDEVWVRQWIASAPYVGSTPVETPTETEDHPRPSAHTVREWARPEAEPEGHYFGPTRSPMAYHNHTAAYGQSLFNLIHPMLGDHTHTPDPGVVALYWRTSFGREGRVAIRQGRRWHRFRIFSNGRVSRAGFVGRANAVRWVNCAPRIEAVTTGISAVTATTDLAHWVETAPTETLLTVPGRPNVLFWRDGGSGGLHRFSPVGTNPASGIAGNYINGTPARRQADSYGSGWTLYRQDSFGNADAVRHTGRVEDAIAWVENVHEEP